MSLLSDILDPSRNHGAMRLIARPLYSWTLAGGEMPERLLMLPPDPWGGAGDAGRGRWLSNRVLDDGGVHIPLETGGRWPACADLVADPRRCATVHGFEWLRDLRALGTEAARRMGRQLMQEWMEENLRWREGVWDYPVTARRLAAWLMGYEFFCASGDDTFLSLFYGSFMRQMRHLDRAHIEKMHGTPALAVIRALIFGGLCLDDGAPRLHKSLKWLDLWIGAEIDADGMHVSRNVSELIDIARYLIEIRAALVRGDRAAPVTLQAALDRIMHAIRFFRLPNGSLACFHGTRDEDETALDALFKVSGVRIRKPPTHLEESGFEALTRDRVTVIADCGTAPLPPYDATVHASPLAFEMTVGRDRMIVNCGTHGRDPVWMDHLRATAAHSGLTIDDRNAMEIRPDGHIGRAPKQMTVQRDVVQGGLMLTMSHDGYAPLNGLVHARRLYLAADGRALKGEDSLISDAPLMKPAAFAIRFHLHPRVQISLIQEGNAALLRLPSGAGWRFSKNAGTLTLEPSIYCGAGHAPRKTQQLVISGETPGGTVSIGWALTEEG